MWGGLQMDYRKKFTSRLFAVILAGTILAGASTAGLWVVAQQQFKNDILLQLVLWSGLSIVIIIFISYIIQRIVYSPTKALVDSIVFAGHKSGSVAPQTKNLFIGKELMTALATEVYDLTSTSKNADQAATAGQQSSTTIDSTRTVPGQSQPQTIQSVAPNILDKVASPLFGIDSDQVVRVANKNALEYIGKSAEQVIGKPFYDALNMSFDNEETFEVWLKKSQESIVNGVRRWERVRINDSQGNVGKQFDFTASFGKQSEKEVIETMIVLFDRTDQYAREDQEISFVALAVHELRTPLTIVKGYIEVFEDELAPTLSPEMVGFMNKMQASAQQLTAFVGNILNVARVEENQLVLTLQQHDWTEVIKTAVADLELRAQVHGKHIEVTIADNIPPVAVDRTSIHEVINNLVDNAIKYSGDSEKIIVTSTVNQDGLVETSIQDFGMGIPASVVPDLFQKFYRSHHSKIQVRGTGLGLYLCKALVSAHNGNIWVRTKEGQGSIFSFTVQTFDQASTEDKGQDGIQRGAHGWIKNHSMNRQ
jgi:signal transduction histidine kinase